MLAIESSRVASPVILGCTKFQTWKIDMVVLSLRIDYFRQASLRVYLPRCRILQVHFEYEERKGPKEIVNIVPDAVLNETMSPDFFS